MIVLDPGTVIVGDMLLPKLEDSSYAVKFLFSSKYGLVYDVVIFKGCLPWKYRGPVAPYVLLDDDIMRPRLIDSGWYLDKTVICSSHDSL